jgi:putative transposase
MEFPIGKMCKVLKVSISGFYSWLKSPESKRAKERKGLVEKIHQVYAASKGRFGSPRVTLALKKQGVRVSRPQVARIMRLEHLQSIVRKKYRVQTTDSNHAYPVSENYLNRNFTAERLGEKWVSDLTYIRTGEGWLYLTTVLDLADRKVIGWAFSETMTATDTTVAAWKMALKNRPLSGSLLFHSDRGVQYACHEFRALFKGLSVVQSMSRKGNCWDNAVAESFFKTLKTELVYHYDFPNHKVAKLAIFEFIEIWYNTQRGHETLRDRTPCQMEAELMNNRQVA